MGTKLKLTDVRCAFLELGEPSFFGGTKQRPNDKRRWSATALIPLASPQKKMVDEALRACAKEKWAAKAEGILANILPDPKACCWTDGNRKADYDGFPGNWVLTSHRNEDQGRPLVMDNDKAPIYKPDNTLYEGKAGRLFSGCYVNLSVELWAQDNASGKGLRCALLGIQRVRTGPAFGGGSLPNPDEFQELADETAVDDLS